MVHPARHGFRRADSRPPGPGKNVMKIEPRELAEIAATQSAAPRVDLYAGIHKALRAFMTDTLLGLGRMDVEDDLDFAQGCQRVAQLLDVLQAHLEHENRFVHSAIEARAQGGSLVVADEHEGHERAILRLVRAVADLMACARADRAPRVPWRDAQPGVAGHRDGGAGGAPITPSRVSGQATIWRMTRTIPQARDADPHTRICDAATAPDLVHCADMPNPGNICHTT